MEYHLGFVLALGGFVFVFYQLVTRYGMDPWNWPAATFSLYTAILIFSANERYGRPLQMAPPEPLYGFAQAVANGTAQFLIGVTVLGVGLTLVATAAPRLPGWLYDHYIAIIGGVGRNSSREDSYRKLKAQRTWNHFMANRPQ